MLPGFIDAHTHIIGRELSDPAADHADVVDFSSYAAILGVENARRTLLAGFTTIRNVGAGQFDDMALRRAVDKGVVPGPRMQNAAHGLGITGGHCDTNGYRPGLMDGDYRTGQADGDEEVRKAVRYQVKYGADVVKICASTMLPPAAAQAPVMIASRRGWSGDRTVSSVTPRKWSVS